MATESRLLEEAGDKLMILHFVNVFLSQGTLPGETPHRLARLLSIAVGLRRVRHSQVLANLYAEVSWKECDHVVQSFRLR